MIKFFRKFNISLISLVFSVAIFGTVTYAWFSFAKSNILDNLQLNITTGDHLEISIDGVNYYKRLPANEIWRSIGDGLSMKDVTSPDGINFSSGPLKAGVARKNIDYLSLNFWFRTTASDKRDVYLIDNISNDIGYDDFADGTFVVSRGINWRADNTFQNGPNPLTDIVRPGQRGMYYGADAIRMAFVEGKDETNPFETRNEEELISFVFDPSGNPERGFGKPYGAYAYFRAKRREDITIPEMIPEVRYELTEFSPTNPYVPLSYDSKVMTLIETVDKNDAGKTYYRGILTVNIWLEGWDADCFASIIRDSIKIQLKFKSGKTVRFSDIINNE